MLTVLVPTRDVIAADRLDFAFFSPFTEDQIAIAAGHEVASLSSICTAIKTGKTAARGGYTDAGVRIIKVKNVRGDGLDWRDRFYVSEHFYASASNKASVHRNDILMLCSAHVATYIGRCDIVLDLPLDIVDDNDRCLSVGELITIRPDPDRVNPEYLLVFLRLPVTQEKIQRLVKGQSAHLYPVDLGKIDIVLPSREVQDEVARLNRAAENAYRSALSHAQGALSASKDAIRSMVLGETSCIGASGGGDARIN